MTKQLAYKAQGYLVKNLPAPFRSKGVIPGKYYDIEITNNFDTIILSHNSHIVYVSDSFELASEYWLFSRDIVNEVEDIIFALGHYDA